MTEHQLQCAVAQYLDHALPKAAIWWAVPNGGDRNPIVAAKMKAEGVKPGVADLMVIHKGQPIAIELKTAKGRLSKAQQAWLERACEAGLAYDVCRSVEDVERALRSHGVPLKATLGAVLEHGF